MSSVRLAQWAVAALVLAGCGGSQLPKSDARYTNIQENSSPVGFISGRVLDAADGKPVPGALVSTFAEAPVLVATDPNGLYRLGPIPAGSYSVFYDGPGFLKRSFPVVIEAGNTSFPVGNTIVTRDVDLSRPDATAAGMVLTNTGQTAGGATLSLDLRDNGFELVATTKTDANGKFKFSGLPGAAIGQFVQIAVAPFDENGDGIPDYQSTQRSFAMFPGFTTYNTITLFASGVQLITSNVSDQDLLATEAITLTFNGAIRVNQSKVTLFRNSGGVQVGTTLEWDSTNTVATLTPVGGPLVEGQAYYVLYNVRAVNGAVTNASLNFVVRPPGGTPPLGTVNNFRLLFPAATDSGLTSGTVGWEALANAGGYRIYGKDSATASAYLLLTSVSSGLATQANVNLNLFDSVQGDSFSTPLGHKNKVQLVIVATDRLGLETPFPTAATIELSDVVAPTVASAAQVNGSANNLTGGSAATVQYQVVFSELMATDTIPQVVLPHPGTSAVWSWNNTNRGTIAITVPAGIDGRGTLRISGGKDTCALDQAVDFDSPLQ